MTLHRLHSGDGYEYLTQQVATGDRTRDRTRDLTDYYTAYGCPPGQWFGRGAAALGLSGEVTEQQMQLLFGEGMHPDANRIITEALADGKSIADAIADASLGTNFYQFSSSTPISELLDRMVVAFTEKNERRPTYDERMMLRTEATRTHLTAELGTDPSTEAIEDALAQEQVKSRKAVAGFDCVFTPQKSIAILWGLADDEVRRVIWECHEEAMRETLEWAEQRYAVTRRGHNGVRQIDANGFAVALFRHYDSRTGDPLPHTHATISTKVQGSDGKWSSLDARPLYGGAVALSCRYNAMIVGKLWRRLGLRFQERSRGRGKQPVLEIVGISDAMIEFFSQRRTAIIARTEQLLAAYRRAHGHNPDKRAQAKLAQQATLETRDAKAEPHSLRDMMAGWDRRVRGFLGDGRDARRFVTDLLEQHRLNEHPATFDARRVAIAAGVAVGGASVVARSDDTHLAAAIERAVDECIALRIGDRAPAIAQVRELLLSRDDDELLADIDDAFTATQRRTYDPKRIAEEVTATIARRRATWTEANIYSAADERVGLCDFDSDIAQRAAVEEIVQTVRDGHSIQLTVDPDPVPAAIARRNGESEFTVTGAIRYTSEEVLAAERRLLDAANTATEYYLSHAAVDEAIAEVERSQPRRRRRLNAAQRAIAHHLCTSGMALTAAIGPAGSGKTTAMKVVSRAWQASGRSVLALGPSKNAARELGNSIGVRGSTVARILTLAKYRLPTGITPGAMLLVDEAAMAATHDLDQLQRLAHQHGAVVRWVGDPHQLSAVESGGALRLVAADTRAPTLMTIVRFKSAAEAAATLAVRAGDTEAAWEFYSDAGRVTSGMVDELRERILTDHLADIAAGKSSLMLAATLDDVAALNLAAQAAHTMSGRVDITRGSVRMSDSAAGYVGDVVVTRLNDNRLRITGGKRRGSGIDNGDLWRIRKVHGDGSITVLGVNHRGSVRLTADYTAANVELGYASTVHRSQGSTVDRCRLLINATLGRALAYVGLTRGAESNHIYQAIDALDPTCEQQPEDPITGQQMFAKVLAREDDNLTATETMRLEQDRIDDPARLRGIYDHITQLLADARSRRLLDRALPVVLYRDAETSDRFQTLLDTIALADQHRLDSRALVADITTNNGQDLGDSLATARDVAAVLCARADDWIAQHLTPATAAVSTSTDTLTADTSDDPTLFAAAAAINRREVLAQSGRFRALRDAPVTGCPPVPSRHPGVDTELADLADELRRRLTGSPGPAATVGTPDAPDPESDRDNFTRRMRIQRLNRLRRDHEHYIKQLSDERGRYLLYRALPVVVYREAACSRHFAALLDAITRAEATGLNSNTLIGSITTDDFTDFGTALLGTRDPASLLADRAQRWVARETANRRTDAAIATGAVKLETLALTDDASTTTELISAVGAANWLTEHAALIPSGTPPPTLSPPPPSFPGIDQRLVDFAAELRKRIADEEHRLRDSDRAAVLARLGAPTASQPVADPPDPYVDKPSPSPDIVCTPTLTRRDDASTDPGSASDDAAQDVQRRRRLPRRQRSLPVRRRRRRL
ncbi:MobF family relaxase [Nocardia arthritidis]|uniref:Relaxase domain-containing protein n=1 Tax=Nocardia arthritidis TaxID=228602 RepID=A0A6G9Y9J1_9NOCA|nr:MobF family relaxase [Nocardia arthritidis]QIS09881.1 relaxase domain-containing protein [Nocardia arthritidis]